MRGNVTINMDTYWFVRRFDKIVAFCKPYLHLLGLKALVVTVLQKALEVTDLQKAVQKSRSDVQRYLNLGWIGVCDLLAGRELRMDKLMILWEEFLSFLLLSKHFLLKLEKMLALWEKILYLLLLYFSFSEFPNRLRPPCTTMPWTIWPALVVLWGVCWMFYDSWDREDQGKLPLADNSAGLFEDNGYSDLYQGFDSDFDGTGFHDTSFDMFIFNTPYFDAPDIEQQLLLGVLGPSAISGTTRSLNSTPTLSAVEPAGIVNAPVLESGNSTGIVAVPCFGTNTDTDTIFKAAEIQAPEAMESRSPMPLTTLVHRQTRNDQVGSSRGSKHGKAENYFCPYSDCIHSQPGSGFKRKDHLDQHLRGPHKQTSVQRLRAKPVTASSVGNPIAVNDITTAPSQSKKRKHRRGEETSDSDLDKLEKELAEERRLRRLAEEDNYLLRQKLENYEGRMEKYEERLDRMMNLLEERKGE